MTVLRFATSPKHYDPEEVAQRSLAVVRAWDHVQAARFAVSVKQRERLDEAIQQLKDALEAPPKPVPTVVAQQ